MCVFVVHKWMYGIFKEKTNVCVFTLVLGAVVSVYTLTLLLSQVDRQVFTSRISSLSTNCCALQPWSHNGSTLIKNSTVFMLCIYRKMSTSQLYAHLFVNMCKISWMLNALYEDLFKSYVKKNESYLFQQTFSRQSLWHDLHLQNSPVVQRLPCIFKCGVAAKLAVSHLSYHSSYHLNVMNLFVHLLIAPSPGRTPQSRGFCKWSLLYMR